MEKKVGLGWVLVVGWSGKEGWGRVVRNVGRGVGEERWWKLVLVEGKWVRVKELEGWKVEGLRMSVVKVKKSWKGGRAWRSVSGYPVKVNGEVLYHEERRAA